MRNCHKCAGYQIQRSPTTGLYEHCDNCNATGVEPGQWHPTTLPILILIAFVVIYFGWQFTR